MGSNARAKGAAGPRQVANHESPSPEIESPLSYAQVEAQPEMAVSIDAMDGDEIVQMAGPTDAEVDKLMEDFIEFPSSRSTSPCSLSSLSRCPSPSSESSFSSAATQVEDRAQKLGNCCNPPVSDSTIDSNLDKADDNIGTTGNSTDELAEPKAHTTIHWKRPIRLKLNPTKKANLSQPRRIILKRSAEGRSLEDQSSRKKRKIVFTKSR